MVQWPLGAPASPSPTHLWEICGSVHRRDHTRALCCVSVSPTRIFLPSWRAPGSRHCLFPPHCVRRQKMRALWRHQAETARQSWEILPLQYRPGQRVHLLGTALLGGGSGRQVRMGPGSVQGKCRPEGGGLFIPPLWILGDKAAEGKWVPSRHWWIPPPVLAGPSPPGGSLPGLWGPWYLFLQRDWQWLPHFHFPPLSLPWASPALL